MRRKIEHLEPAASVIAKLGGVPTLAKGIATTTTTVQRWRWPREVGGTGGVIPHWRHDDLLAFAQRCGVALAHEQLVRRPNPSPSED